MEFFCVYVKTRKKIDKYLKVNSIKNKYIIDLRKIQSEEDLDIKKAKLWIDKCSDLRQDLPYWMLNQKALIYHAFGSVDKSIEIAKKGLKLANETNIKDSINTLKETLSYVSNN